MKNIFKVLISLIMLVIIVLITTNIIYNNKYKNGYYSYDCCPDDENGPNYELPCNCEYKHNMFEKMIVILFNKNI